jgi:uncharacterized protein (DUF58 family)
MPPWPSPRSSLVLLDWVGLLVCFAILVFAVWFDVRPVALVAALLVTVAGGARVWARSALWRVDYGRKLDTRRAFPGETLTLNLCLTNAKPVPVAWLNVVEQVSPALRPVSGSWVPSADGTSGGLVQSLSLLWYRRISWRQKLHCRRRGCYTIGPARLIGGDAFGLYSQERLLSATEEVIVYPRILPIDQLDFLAGVPMGEIRAGQPIFEDPCFTVGIREYQPTDALKRIHWKATARQQRMQVRVYEPTTTVERVLVLGLDGFGGEAAEEDERFELAVSAIASLAHHAVSQRQMVGLLVNGGTTDSSRIISLKPGAGQTDLMRILEALARITPTPARPLPEMLLEENAAMPRGATFTVVAGAVDATLVEALRQLRRQGRPVCLCSLGGDSALYDEVGVPIQGLALGGNATTARAVAR